MKQWLPGMALIGALCLFSCAGMGDSVSTVLRAVTRWEGAQTAEITRRARDLERQGELVMALDHWRVVHQISNDQAPAGQEIARLREKIDTAVQFHYQQGLANLQQNQMPAARNQFLAALHLDPTFEPALQQVQANFSPFPLAVYLAAPEDTATTVAQKFFGDGEKAFIVAWFNDLEDGDALKPGQLLLLPKPAVRIETGVPQKEVLCQLCEASARLAENDLDNALALAKQADRSDPEVQFLIDRIYFKMALAANESGRLEAAQHALARVSEGFTGKPAAEAALQVAVLDRQIESELGMARTHFDHGQYQQSLDLAEAVTLKAPDMSRARDLAAEARYRLALNHYDQERFLEARAVLEQSDQGHADSAVLQETVRTRLSELAQAHYHQGVKYFINEDLQSAIAAWEMSLLCDPDHANARDNIENARRLLQKLETLP